MNSKMLSIIVPVYNREKTIAECLKGITAIKENAVEIIVVDDGSTDSSLEVCNNFQSRDSRIKILHKENGGVSSARNCGLDSANGEWILFVDSDDSICPDVTNLIPLAKKHNADLVLFNKTYGSLEDFKEKRRDVSDSKIKFMTGNKNCIEYIFGDYSPERNEYYFVRTKLFRNSLIQRENIRFDKAVSLGEDQCFVCEYLKHIRSALFVSESYSIELKFNMAEKSYSLGGTLRSPENFLENQIANYKALMGLYESCGVQSVKEYALYYITDRPVTRILMKYACFKNRKLYPYRKLKSFFIQNVSPLFRSLDFCGGGMCITA